MLSSSVSRAFSASFLQASAKFDVVRIIQLGHWKNQTKILTEDTFSDIIPEKFLCAPFP